MPGVDVVWAVRRRPGRRGDLHQHRDRSCAGSGPACNTPLNLAYFVAVDGTWQVVTNGLPCAQVIAKIEPGLPPALCAQAGQPG